MFFDDALSKTILDLGELVYQEPPPSVLCQFLATRICPSGELVRVCVGRVDRDGFIRPTASFGYPVDSKLMETEIPLESNRPLPEAIKQKKIILLNKEDILERYPEYQPIDMRSPWASSALVPTMGIYAFAFLSQQKIIEKEFYEIYYKIVGQLLSFYNFDRAMTINKLVETDGWISKISEPQPKKGGALTERQKQILDQIKEKKTNGQIAEHLGYSESLIRQETIIIYAKLGIKGRKELIIKNF